MLIEAITTVGAHNQFSAMLCDHFASVRDALLQPSAVGSSAGVVERLRC